MPVGPQREGSRTFGGQAVPRQLPISWKPRVPVTWLSLSPDILELAKLMV